MQMSRVSVKAEAKITGRVGLGIGVRVRVHQGFHCSSHKSLVLASFLRGKLPSVLLSESL